MLLDEDVGLREVELDVDAQGRHLSGGVRILWNIAYLTAVGADGKEVLWPHTLSGVDWEAHANGSTAKAQDELPHNESAS